MGRSWNPLSPQSLNPEVIMETYTLTVNGQPKEVTIDPGTPLLWVLREDLKMTGTKYGCGIAACGACTDHLGGVASGHPFLDGSGLSHRRPSDRHHAGHGGAPGRARRAGRL